MMGRHLMVEVAVWGDLLVDPVEISIIQLKVVTDQVEVAVAVAVMLLVQIL